jgi:hypothetical protein
MFMLKKCNSALLSVQHYYRVKMVSFLEADSEF